MPQKPKKNQNPTALATAIATKESSAAHPIEEIKDEKASSAKLNDKQADQNQSSDSEDVSQGDEQMVNNDFDVSLPKSKSSSFP
jgi:hypothetical protein